MNKFPSWFKPNKFNKEEKLKDRKISKIRVKLYDYIISQEKGGFSIGNENLDYVKEVCSELEKKGWACDFLYGDTVLFIYDKKNPPSDLLDIKEKFSFMNV